MPPLKIHQSNAQLQGGFAFAISLVKKKVGS
jgi:hypothetical protein